MDELAGFLLFGLFALLVVGVVLYVLLALLTRALSVVVLWAVASLTLAVVAGAATGVVVPLRLVRGRASSDWRQLTPEDVVAGTVLSARARGEARHHGWDHAWPTYFPYQAREDVVGVLSGVQALTRRPWAWAARACSRKVRGQDRDSGPHQYGATTAASSPTGTAKQAARAGGRGLALLPRALLASVLFPPVIGYVVGLWVSTITWVLLLVVVGGAVLAVQRLALGAYRQSDVLRRRRARAQLRCPRPGCYQVSTLPGFRCDGPGCETVHHDLMPGPLGLITRRCGCGTTLPNSVRRAAARLRPVCPSCGVVLEPGSGNRQTIQVAVIGSQGAGKSRLLAAATVALEVRLGQASGSLAPLGSEATAYVRAARALIARGESTSKTAAEPPTGLPLLLSAPDRTPVELQLMDVGGEGFADWQTTTGLRYLDAAEAIVAVIDPLALPEVRDQLVAAEDVEEILVASEDQEGAYAAAVDRMRAEGVPVHRRRLAVVLTKADVIARLPVGDGLEEGSSASVRSWMLDHGLDGMVRRCERDFTAVDYLALDSMSTDVAGSATDPLRAIHWVLSVNRAPMASVMVLDDPPLSVEQPAGASS